MRKHQQIIPEYTPEPDQVTYQTGSTKPPKYYRGVIAVLLIVVTGLGGLVSALGIFNIHLLLELKNQQVDTAPVGIHPDGQQSAGNPYADPTQEPTLPTHDRWNLDLAEPSQQEAPAAQVILEKNADTTVTVVCQYIAGSTATLSGVVVDEAGYIVTHAHPLCDAEQIFVQLSGGETYRATLVGIDGFTNIAVIFIDAPGLTAAEFVNSQSLDQGDFLASVCDRQTLSEGSLQDNTNGYPLGDDLVYLMRTDLAHFVGPVYNAQGQIAGFGSIFLSDCCPGTNVTLSSITVKAVVEQLIAQGSMAGRPMVDAAMEEVQPLHQRYWNLPSGLRFTQVKEGSFAAMAGLETGDILISLGGHPITDWESYYRALWNFCPGQQVDATVYRNQQYITISITVAQSGT